MNDIQKFYLLESGRWEKIIGIYMVVCAALMALLGLFFIIGGIAGLDLFEMGGGGALGMAAGIGMGLFYILIGVLYYFFARSSSVNAFSRKSPLSLRITVVSFQVCTAR